MYNISTELDKPDIQYMLNEAKRMMNRGIKLKDLRDIYNKYNSLREKLYKDFSETYGVLNPNSNPQLSHYLQAMSDKLTSMGATNDIYEICFVDGKWTTNKDAMLKLHEIGYEFATDLLMYRLAKKYAETVEGLMKAADENGIIHPEVALGKTNRLQYKKPGILSIPKAMLWNLIAPMNEGNKLYSVDIKNQEPNILINLLGADELKSALTAKEGLYEHLFSKVYIPRVTLNIAVAPKGVQLIPKLLSREELEKNNNIQPAYYLPLRAKSKSLYVKDKRVELINQYNTMTMVDTPVVLPEKVEVSCTGGDVYELDVDWIDGDKVYKQSGTYTIQGVIKGIDVKCSKEERAEFKTAWLAMTYGASKPGILAMCKSLDGSVIYDYFNNIEGFKKYNSMCNKHAKQGMQYIKTLFGTVMFADEPNSRRLRRVLLDLPVQGTGADILSLLIKHFNTTLSKRGIVDKLQIYYTRHDELIIEADRDWVNSVGDKAVKALLTDILEHQIDDWTPFKVEVNEVTEGELPEISISDMEESE
ncbi:MAG: Ig-like domain-containing protein [Lachnospiraceae bacterium]|nr:Ig-like domain-containing protein [Lachnospiraceae bacterium]